MLNLYFVVVFAVTLFSFAVAENVYVYFYIFSNSYVYLIVRFCVYFYPCGASALTLTFSFASTHMFTAILNLYLSFNAYLQIYFTVTVNLVCYCNTADFQFWVYFSFLQLLAFT